MPKLTDEMSTPQYTAPRPLSSSPSCSGLFGPPALRTTRRARIKRRPIVYLSDAERAYSEGYDASEAYPEAAASIVQRVFDARRRRGSSPLLVIEAGRDENGRLLGACAVADPGPLFSGPHNSKLPQRAGRVAA